MDEQHIVNPADQIMHRLRSEGKGKVRSEEETAAAAAKRDSAMAEFIAEFHQRQSSALLRASLHTLTD